MNSAGEEPDSITLQTHSAAIALPSCLSLVRTNRPPAQTPSTAVAAASGRYPAVVTHDGGGTEYTFVDYFPACMFNDRTAQMVISVGTDGAPSSGQMFVTQPDGGLAVLALSNGYNPAASSGPARHDLSDPASWLSFSPAATFIPGQLRPDTTFQGSFHITGGDGSYHGRVVSAAPEVVAGTEVDVVHLAVSMTIRSAAATVPTEWTFEYSDIAWVGSLRLVVGGHAAGALSVNGTSAPFPGAGFRLTALKPT